ncbi:MAG TPA: Rieske 2Fe-2S domain-containing protein [Candidatus Binataceae bacterium]|nr:Rieske 2Fe-2S domain-containing protein [Candidatus Binataceae bacterium]
MADSDWIVVEGVNPQTAQYPLGVEAGGEEILIFRVGAKLCGIQRICPHQEADLEGGKVMGEMLKCPHHGYIFRFDSGRCLNFPGVNAEVYEVSSENDTLRVRRRA